MAATITKPKGLKSDKEWRDAIRLAVHELRADPRDGKKVKTLRLLARSVIDKALDGDVAALKEIGDRLDGKVAQVVQGDGDAPIRLIVERVIHGSDDQD